MHNLISDVNYCPRASFMQHRSYNENDVKVLPLASFRFIKV